MNLISGHITWNTFILDKRRTHSLFAFILLGIIAFSMFSTSAGAEPEIEIKMALQRSRIELGEQAQLTVTVSGPSGFTDPIFPKIDGLSFNLQGRSQSVKIVNMKVNASKVFGYSVVPDKEGEFLIGPVTIERQNVVYTSNTVKLSVSEQRPVQSVAPGHKKVFVEASVDNGNPYVGQQITLFFRLARRADVNMKNASYQLPELNDFWSEGMQSERKYTQKIGDIDYIVTEVSVPVFPTREGAMTIGGITLNYNEIVGGQGARSPFPNRRDPFGRSVFDDDFFDRFFNTGRVEKRILRTRPIEINVRPLPLEGRPENFEGGVGVFRVASGLSENEAKAGESVTLTIVVSGQGNIRDLADPKLEFEGVKTYSDSPVTDIKNYNGEILGEKVYKPALVPQRLGEIQIPQISIPYFNAETERYEVASSGPLTINVAPSEEEAFVVTRPDGDLGVRRRKRPIREDILPIHEMLGPTKESGFTLWFHRLRPGIYTLPMIIFASCFALVRRRERLRTDTAYRRYTFASKTARAHIENAANALNHGALDEVFSECSKAVTEFLADKFNIPAAGLTPQDIREELSARGLPDEFLKKIIGFLEGCDYGRFASSKESKENAGNYIDGAVRIIERLEGEEVVRK